jgi:hypothetical protein
MKNSRRNFIKNIGVTSLTTAILPTQVLDASPPQTAAPKGGTSAAPEREFNGVYAGENLNRIAFPIGGMGSGMFCVEGNGAISHMSVRHKPEVFLEPGIFMPFMSELRMGQDPQALHLNGRNLECQIPVMFWRN